MLFLATYREDGQCQSLAPSRGRSMRSRSRGKVLPSKKTHREDSFHMLLLIVLTKDDSVSDPLSL